MRCLLSCCLCKLLDKIHVSASVKLKVMRFGQNIDVFKVRGHVQKSHGSRSSGLYIVACHLARGSKLRWRKDMGGELPLPTNGVEYIHLSNTDQLI